MADEFFALPDASEVEDYYKIISRPISIKEINKQLRSGDYTCLDDLLQDFQLMFDNCDTYNEPNCTPPFYAAGFTHSAPRLLFLGYGVRLPRRAHKPYSVGNIVFTL